MAHGWALGSRALGMILLGLRAVREDGGDIKLPRAIARALIYLVFPPGILWAAVSSKNASIQDLIVDTAVVYDRRHRAEDLLEALSEMKGSVEAVLPRYEPTLGSAA